MFWAILASAAAATVPPPDHAPLLMHTDPEGAEVLVLPLDQKVKPFQCRAPCTVKIPQRLAFQIYAVEHGYRMKGAQEPVEWQRVKGGWDLTTHEVTLHLTPVGAAAQP